MGNEARTTDVWREGYVPGGDTRFFVRALGHGDDVAILLHGWPEDGTAWRRVAPALAAEGWRVVCPDLKGMGRSDKPARGYDAETLADEVSQLIRSLHVKKALVVGHDWGGAVALATAFRHPGRVRGLVLVSSPYRHVDLRTAWHIPLFNLPVLPDLAFRLAARPLVRTALRRGASVTEPFTDEVVDAYAEQVGQDPGSWLAYYRGLSRRAAGSWLVRRLRTAMPVTAPPPAPPTLRVPALVVWGEDDPALPVSLAAGVADDLGADLVTLAGVGHFVPEEDPLGLARAIASFAGVPAAGAAGA